MGLTLKKLLGAEFLTNPAFTHAVTHRSMGRNNNERMEFLGDSVLGLIITQALYEQLPDAVEGYLSRLRASLVNEGVLAEIANELNLGDQLRLGSGELKSGGFRRKSILADALEAVIASVYLTQGFEAARTFVLALFERRLQNLPAENDLKDPKSRLQEYLQSQGHPVPVYNLIATTGDAHKQTFTAECLVDALKLRTEAQAGSRRKAEQLCATAAIEALKL